MNYSIKERIRREDTYMNVVTRVWSWIGKHSLILVTWQRNWGPGAGWVFLGKSLPKAWLITP